MRSFKVKAFLCCNYSRGFTFRHKEAPSCITPAVDRLTFQLFLMSGLQQTLSDIKVSEQIQMSAH